MVNSISNNQDYNYESQTEAQTNAELVSASFASILSTATIGDAEAEFTESETSSAMSSDSGISADLMFSMLGSGSGYDGFIQLFSSVLQSGSLGNSSSLMSSLLNSYGSYGSSLLGGSADYTSNSPYSCESLTYQEAIPAAASKATNPFVTSSTSNRSASLYRDVIDQFNVETNPRYEVNKKGRNDTYCNIFVWDVTSAMGAEIPHYVDAETGEPRTYPNVEGAREMTANATYDWLAEKGSDYGWTEVTAEQAQLLANQGHPVVTAKKNPSGHGHVQVVCPSADGQYNAARGVTIAQAGSTLTDYSTMSSLYSASGQAQFKYYAHV